MPCRFQFLENYHPYAACMPRARACKSAAWRTIVEEEVEPESDLGDEVHEGEDANL
jgi:hypothetical protein